MEMQATAMHLPYPHSENIDEKHFKTTDDQLALVDGSPAVRCDYR